MKKIIAILLFGLLINFSFPVTALVEENNSNVTVEHIKLPKKLAKKTPTDVVNLYAEKTNILPYNTLQVAFAESFNSKNAKVGDEVVFVLPNPLMTKEGTEVLPASTKIVAEVTNVIKPKAFNRSGKVYLDFKRIELPDGTTKDIRAKLFTKNDFLSRGKLNAMGKGLGSTLGGMAIGTAAGCGIGVAAGAVIIGGFAIGMPVGFAVGAAAGLMTPGLYYKAKAGDVVNIQLLDNVVVGK
jgi:hypothetical protein